MTHAKTRTNDTIRWYTQAGAASSIVPLSRFVTETIFALKGGGYGCLFSLAGIDPECVSDLELESHLRMVEGALRGLPEGARLYQYTRVRSGPTLPHRDRRHPVVQNFVDRRHSFLNETAELRRIELFWCLTLEPETLQRFERTPESQKKHSTEQLAELEKTAERLIGNLGSTLSLRLLIKQDAFRFFRYLFNLEEWAGESSLTTDLNLDRQIAESPVEWRDDHLRVGRRFVQVFSLTSVPEASRPGLFGDLSLLDADSILCSMWRPRSVAATRKEIEAQEKFISFFKVGVLSRLMSGTDTASLEMGAGAKAANAQVDDLSEVVRSLDAKAQGEFSLRLLLATRTVDELHRLSPAVHRTFVEGRCRVMEETLGNLSAFYAMFPGNAKFNVFSMWLGEQHHARLSFLFAPHLGHTWSDDLNQEYLNVFETRTGTPYFQDAYVHGVRVMLILGPTGAGKSVYSNLAVAHEQKYGGFTFLFDIGGSYQSVVELYGGKVDRIGIDGPRVNPFALEPTESNFQFLYTFVKLLLTNGGTTLEPEDDDVIHKAVRDLYLLDPSNRRLANLYLPRKLDRYLAKWVGNGVYHRIFDNVDDSLSLARLQCFDFQGIHMEQNADLIEPLMVWLLRRLNDVLFDPANLGVPKHIVIEELFSSMKNRQLLDAALASIKTVRKNLGGVTMIGQSAEDLGENADSIVNSCTSFLFLRDATFNRARYAELFKLTDHQLALFESLAEREALYVRRDGITKVLKLNLDPFSYAAFSTKPKDRVRRAQLIAEHGLTEGLVRF